MLWIVNALRVENPLRLGLPNVYERMAAEHQKWLNSPRTAGTKILGTSREIRPNSPQVAVAVYWPSVGRAAESVAAFRSGRD